jgi:hypothetical protein
MEWITQLILLIMTFSKEILSTDKNKTKLNWFQYWIGHCWMTGWQSIRISFRIWSDLMTNKFDDYGLLKTDDPYTECYEWFWVTLGEDDTYPKEFLEYLMELAEDVKNNPEKLTTFKTVEEMMADLDNE